MEARDHHFHSMCSQLRHEMELMDMHRFHSAAFIISITLISSSLLPSTLYMANASGRTLLNQLFNKPQQPRTGVAGRPGLSGRNQIQGIGTRALQGSSPFPNPIAIHHNLGDCQLQTASLDTRGRPQKTVRFTLPGIDKEFKMSFKSVLSIYPPLTTLTSIARTYHITWIGRYGQITSPTLEYSHRCHQECCINPSHGVWETSKDNQARDGCKFGGTFILPNRQVLVRCPHTPVCLTGDEFSTWDDPKFVQM